MIAIGDYEQEQPLMSNSCILCDFALRTLKFFNTSIMIPFPDISPELFSFTMFGTEIVRWYAMSYIAGFCCASSNEIFIRRDYLWSEKQSPMSLDQADTILTYLILG